MKECRSISTLFYMVVLLQAALYAQKAVHSTAQPVDWVNPYIGTGGGGTEYGGTMPLVTPPFGMTTWTAQTRQNKISVTSYAYEDSTISGFIGTHQPAIWMGDYGYVTLMPESEEVRLSPDARKQVFSRADEIATPYYYSVKLGSDPAKKIHAEMTATAHCGFLRFSFPDNATPIVLLEATRPGIPGFVKVDPSRSEIYGYNPDRMDSHLGPFTLPHFRGYFVARFNKRFAAYDTYTGTTATAGDRSLRADNVGAYVKFARQLRAMVAVKIGTSFISIDQARANLDAEIPQWDFEGARARVRQAWNEKLTRVYVEGATDEQRTIFYTGLYHSLLYPKLFSEHGHYYSPFDDRIHSGVSYTAYSLWDTFRAEHSLLTLVAPEYVSPMITALLQDYKEGGWMPKWPNPSYTNIMVGTHADSVIAEAMNKGFHGFDYDLAYRAVYKDAMTPPDGDTTRRWSDREEHTPYEARAGLTYSKRLGYIPVDKIDEAASSTLEDAYDDWAMAVVAKVVGKMSEYDYFKRKSLNYKLLFNKSTGFMQGRKSDGSWAEPDEGWTEGDHWVYTWSVLHDIPGLVELCGGSDRFTEKLDEHFTGGHNRHDNEPSHHIGYLYDYAGQPAKTQWIVRKIATTAYSNTPAGIQGNEDLGQMSAWYVFTAMGFYPVNPVSGDYMIGSPLFRRVSIKLSNGKTFVVSAADNSEENIYIQSAMLNGRTLDKPVVTYREIEAGGELQFAMGPVPSAWGSTWKAKPLR